MPALIDGYAGVVCDLDGVVYRGPVAAPYAVETLSSLPQPVVWATNNASRTPGEVASHLRSLGLDLEDDDVLTSSLAGALFLADSLSPMDAVLAVGGPGVGESLRAAGLTPVSPDEHRDGAEVCAVLQGYGPAVSAVDLAEAAYAVQQGARWVATNVDRTLPTDRGLAPGNGTLVSAVATATGRDPEVVGKPHPPMYRLAATTLGLETRAVLAVGDRLETDIAGAGATGMDSVLVLTGVHGFVEAAAAPGPQRPTYVLEDLRGLLRPYPEGAADGTWFRRGPSGARVVDGRLETEGEPGAGIGRAALDAVWAAVDAGTLEPGAGSALLRRASDEGLLASSEVA